jgi:site-specific recombinase XerD
MTHDRQNQPAPLIDVPTPQPPLIDPLPEVIPVDEHSMTAARMAAAIQAADHLIGQKAAAICELTIQLGLRPAEIRTLTLTSVASRTSIRFVRAKSRGRKQQVLPLNRAATPRLVDYCLRQLEHIQLYPARPLFPRKSSNYPMSERAINDVLHHAGRLVGFPELSPRLARHFAATALSRYAGVRAAQVLLGHSSLETTATYLDCGLETLAAGLAAARPTGAPVK